MQGRGLEAGMRDGDMQLNHRRIASQCDSGCDRHERTAWVYFGGSYVDHGGPVLEVLLRVTQLDDLALVSACAADLLQRQYTSKRMTLLPSPAALACHLILRARDLPLRLERVTWLPYLLHTGHELPLLLEGRQCPESDVYPPERHFDEDRFDRYVAQGVIHKEVVVEPFAKPLHVHGRVYEGQRIVYYARKGEEWRIQASKLIWSAAMRTSWSDDFERMEGMLFGYEDWECDWWIAHRRSRREDCSADAAAP